MSVYTHLELALEEVPEPLRRSRLYLFHAGVSCHGRRCCQRLFLFLLFEDMLFYFGKLELPLKGFKVNLLFVFVQVTEIGPELVHDHLRAQISCVDMVRHDLVSADDRYSCTCGC